MKSLSLPRLYFWNIESHVSMNCTHMVMNISVVLMCLFPPSLDLGSYVSIYLWVGEQEKKLVLLFAALLVHYLILIFAGQVEYFFESLTAPARHDLAISESHIELSINYQTSLQRPRSKAISHFDLSLKKERGNAWKERFCRIDILMSKKLEQDEFSRP